MGSYSPAGPSGRASVRVRSRAGDARAGGCPRTWLAWPWHSAGGAVGHKLGLSAPLCREPSLPGRTPARSSWEERESKPGCRTPPHPEVPPPPGRQLWSQPQLGAPARPSPQASRSPWPCTDEARAGVSTTGFLTLNTGTDGGDQSCADGPACSPWSTPLRPTRTHRALRVSPPVFAPVTPDLLASAQGPGHPPSPLAALTLPPVGQQSWSLPHVCSHPQGLPAAPSWGSEGLLGATGETQRGQRPGSHSRARRAWGRNPGLLCEPYFNYRGEGGGVWLTRLQGTAGPDAGGPPGPGDSAGVGGWGVDRGRILPSLCAFQGDRLQGLNESMSKREGAFTVTWGHGCPRTVDCTPNHMHMCTEL